MELLVLFGSQSDQHIFGPLLAQLAQADFSSELKILSAHRNPQELERALSEKAFDVVIAGAGLAAHLPGAVASRTSKPVIGIPVSANLGGFDAFLSIVQMPYGVPVLTSRVDEIKTVIHVLEKIRQMKRPQFNLVFDLRECEAVGPEVERCVAFLKEQKLDEALSVGECVKEEAINLSFVSLASSLGRIIKNENAIVINVPVLADKEKRDPQMGMRFFQQAESLGDLWVGINNGRD